MHTVRSLVIAGALTGIGLGVTPSDVVADEARAEAVGRNQMGQEPRLAVLQIAFVFAGDGLEIHVSIRGVDRTRRERD